MHIGKKYKELKEQSKMTNEEINILINMHIEELENEDQTIKTKNIIKALRKATEIIEGSNHIPRLD